MKDRIRKIIACDPAIIKDDTLIVGDGFGVDENPALGADSLDLVSIRMGVEDAFGIEISDRRWAEARTISDIESLVS